ncbi:hypothetical protein WISP_23349 [Willisornis vidua]|uniref:Uncharacterized protein n=1 Tax=Willisornis vidua TaxID=1566151 RepID=A0ABQ9DT20_9PASS|nr:hypothetical protein WISP_23349 [Willisornis vidua]
MSGSGDRFAKPPHLCAYWLPLPDSRAHHQPHRAYLGVLQSLQELRSRREIALPAGSQAKQKTAKPSCHWITKGLLNRGLLRSSVWMLTSTLDLSVVWGSVLNAEENEFLLSLWVLPKVKVHADVSYFYFNPLAGDVISLNQSHENSTGQDKDVCLNSQPDKSE